MNLETRVPAHQNPQPTTIRGGHDSHIEAQPTVAQPGPVSANRKPRSGSVLALAQAEGDESMGRIIGGQAHCHPIPRNDSDAEAPHPPGKLRGHVLARLEGNLIATPAENLVDAARRLNQVVSCQVPLSMGANPSLCNPTNRDRLPEIPTPERIQAQRGSGTTPPALSGRGAR